MISAQRTGAYISSLRKSRDWTQQQLAETLLVSHQAVSQWEKGLSFPDIGLLPQLAQLLGVTVDDLLNGQSIAAARPSSRGAMLAAFAQEKPAEVARLALADPEGAAALLETAPLARPSQLSQAVQSMSGYNFSLEQVLGLAPFVSPTALESMLEKIGVAEWDWQTVAGLAPFVGTEWLGRLIEQVGGDGVGWEHLGEVAPFLSDKTLTAMSRKLLAAGQLPDDEQVKGLAPHVEQAVLDELLRRRPDGKVPVDFVCGIAPFIGEAGLDRLIERLENRAELGEHLNELAPHLSRASLARAVAQAQDRLSAQDIVGIAPFLDQDTLAGLIQKKRGA